MLRRWIIRGFFVGLLLLCVTGFAWTLRYSGFVAFDHGGNSFRCDTDGGTVDIFLGMYGPRSPNPDGLSWGCYAMKVHDISRTSAYEGGNFLGMGYQENGGSLPDGRSFQWYKVIVPYWFLMAFFLVALGVAWWKTGKVDSGKGAYPVERVLGNDGAARFDGRG